MGNFELSHRSFLKLAFLGLFSTISAIVLRNRDADVIKTILTESAWHSRLLNGSDYPLPGVLPLILVESFVESGLLPEACLDPLLALQDYHPFRFDFVLKRSLSWQGKRFANSVFETRPFFVGSNHLP